MASSSTSSFEKKYPYPSEFKVREFVPELDENNYEKWKKLMVNFIKCQGLFGFIDGTIEAPPERVPASDDGGGEDVENKEYKYWKRSNLGGGEDVENEEYKYWKRSNLLVRGWILAMLPKNILQQVLPYTTARKVWIELKEIFDYLGGFQLDEDKEKSLSYYRSLHIAAINGDWESASKFIQENPDAVRAPITLISETALHVAIRSVQRNDFVKKLVEKMSPQDLALPDQGGQTALHLAAVIDNIEAAKLLVEKNPNLPNVRTDRVVLPVHYAALRGNREMVFYLWEATRLDDQNESCAQLLSTLTIGGLYDIALTLLQRYPKLACMEKHSALKEIVERRSSFRSGTPLNFWQNLIYTNVPMKLENIANHHSCRRGDNENPVDCFISRWTYVKQRLCAMFWRIVEKIVPQMEYIREMKLIHHQALELVKLLCEEVAKSGFRKAAGIFWPVLLKATSVGIHEIVEEILGTFPSAISLVNPKQQTILQYAIACRRENVFNLIYQLKEFSWAILTNEDALGNNGLHLAACLEPQPQLRLRVSAAGAALQMQRELQWFKEVEKFGPPTDKYEKNDNGMIPAEIFTDTHQELVKEGERWMKDTATSCTIVAALIATVVFAAAITVPGGNDNNSGQPFFSKQNAFIVFGISDAFALFSSITSVLMFLSILTARYAEQDFLYALPKRLIIGLGTLFVSMLSTMIAFGATLYLVFGDNKAWILIPIVAFGCIPVTLFIALQFPLFVVMTKSTYGPSIFRKQSDRMLL